MLNKSQAQHPFIQVTDECNKGTSHLLNLQQPKKKLNEISKFEKWQVKMQKQK